MIINQFKTLSLPPNKDLEGKVSIVTGGSEGIGLGTAILLAKLKSRVIIASRSAQKCEKAVIEIKQKTGNNNVEYITLDLSSFASVRNFVRQVKENTDKVDVVINNAGCVYHTYETTGDGIEKNLQINHLAPLLLTLLLVPIIPKSASSRIIFVSSNLHLSGKIIIPDTLNLAKDKFNRAQRYNDTKLMNVLTVKELSKKLSQTAIIVAAADPGFTKSNLGAANNSDDFWGKLEVFLIGIFSSLLARNEEQGAMTSVYTAIADDISKGGYYDACAPAKYHPIADDEQFCDEFYKQSLELIGFDDKEIFQ
ncbi:NAD(P)-binding protein [Conidiobolus coronatus NRRL 28638]|uniref:NAD(P)-binding protein n=1 Tax=Conidiobolus coronatus (strain ATCC 28846 / CBS 209.66 / NRRL 28638) TaxID=796925 RepID=A0A137P4L7_CONC2|nr:NAD(P)-binding protein [Conidiobolus coronatus NRRL 28638]|eukprot:KXN69881.1 NAD(P)-binding protein [Conidiobolus coronatus NRRL 28638]